MSRKITGGRSVAKINSESISAAKVKEAAQLLIDIHGQHEHQSLLNPVKHIRLLDRFCGAGFGEAMEEYKNSRQILPAAAFISDFFFCQGKRL